MKRKTIIGATAALVVAATGAGITVNATADGGGKRERRGPGAAMTTAPVERGDLSDSTSVQGTLGYGGERKLKAGAGGTVTWVKSPGATVRLNGRLYELDGRPVRLMYGTRPMYRTLKTGDEGPDVLQLEKNLSALGYSLTVDQKYTAATADAVRRWQKAHDGKATGTVGPDAIVFAPGPVRVKSRDASAGDRVTPGSPVVTSSGAEQVVSLKLEVDQASTLRKGTKVTVELPAGRTARGAVRSIGTTAAKDGGGGDEGEAKVDVIIELDHPSKAGGLDQAPVTVNITTQTSKNVLSVPVQALLALPGGGYGVRVVTPGTPRTVKVELGVFGDGRVEVAGEGLSEGMKVEVPKS
ncbi:efflux RND transporter periplasmic adaptor subunit [Actinomadura rudentiformis]|uniref:HlyD family efflux transporter periplasmic adaptor subunit n=1 Tax=Actinomadura rudentiformis TaxID=359158 RepID=A0A6H9Z0Q1_9ACTN|nr:peptidoglycan-binding protein [Actinomadura rudentiformis]KAB2347451.1 HlyD family efflux transporter periplasmic adaptor subunit [Actinomadura rudentiformis]